jgi:hypothetical protein
MALKQPRWIGVSNCRIWSPSIHFQNDSASHQKCQLCQKTGKGKRKDTASGIAGDGVEEMCEEQLVPSSYPARMDERKKDQRQQASKKDYKEDLTRGPSCIQNTVNQALLLNKKVWEIRERIEQNEYDKRLREHLECSLLWTSRGRRGRYSKKLADFEAALGKPYKKGT